MSERSALHLRSILATVPDPMVVTDKRGTILSFSATAEQLFGYSDAQVGSPLAAWVERAFAALASCLPKKGSDYIITTRRITSGDELK